jgi:glycine/D-amino acid oxidase-like deaminating enzyme
VSRARVVVIGAGVVGANVAYRLAQAGAEVIVLDAGAPGGGTSGASFAWVNSFWKEPRDYYDLNVAGMAEHGRIAEELGGGAWLARCRATAIRWSGASPDSTASTRSSRTAV